MVAWWTMVAKARGGAVDRSANLVIIDGVGPNAVVNRAVVLTPEAEADAVSNDVANFFGRRAGGATGVLDPFETLDLRGNGFDGPVVLPEMVFHPSTHAAPAPSPEVVNVVDEVGLAAFDHVVRHGFHFVPWGDEPILPAAVLGGRSRLFVSYADGAPLACAAAHDHAGVTGVYMVATLAEARGRGLGTAVSWAATTAFGNQPATLQASAMGRPIYERMGYEATRQMQLWLGERRHPKPEPVVKTRHF